MDQDNLKLPTTEDENYDIRIARDGTWFYHDSPIGRKNLVKLFSTVLKLNEKGEYWLITPAERGRITVEDVPFTVITLNIENNGENQRLIFHTNLDHEIVAGADHPIKMKEGTPYIIVKDNLEARIVRPVYYQLVEYALDLTPNPNGDLTIQSEGEVFSLGQVS